MSENNICPGCGRRCDLNEPHCGRGKNTAVLGTCPSGSRGKNMK